MGTRCRQQLLQTSSSQKLLHLQTLFFAHMKFGLGPTNFVHNSFIKCTQRAKKLFPLKIFFSKTKSGAEKLNTVLDS
jgi:hypothetical protein